MNPSRAAEGGRNTVLCEQRLDRGWSPSTNRSRRGAGAPERGAVRDPRPRIRARPVRRGGDWKVDPARCSAPARRRRWPPRTPYRWRDLGVRASVLRASPSAAGGHEQHGGPAGRAPGALRSAFGLGDGSGSHRSGVSRPSDGQAGREVSPSTRTSHTSRSARRAGRSRRLRARLGGRVRNDPCGGVTPPCFE